MFKIFRIHILPHLNGIVAAIIYQFQCVLIQLDLCLTGYPGISFGVLVSPVKHFNMITERKRPLTVSL